MKRKRLWPLCLLLCLTMAAVSVASCDKENSDNIEFVKNAPKQNYVVDHCRGWAPLDSIMGYDNDDCHNYHPTFFGWENYWGICYIIISDDCYHLGVEPPIGPDPNPAPPIYIYDDDHINPSFREYLDACVERQEITLQHDSPILSDAIAMRLGKDILPSGTYTLKKDDTRYILYTNPKN